MINIAFREIQTFLSDDGRKIEILARMGILPFQVEKDNETTEQDSKKQEEGLVSMSNKEKIFVGVTNVMFPPPHGIKEIKFEIPDVITIEEAFVKHQQVATEVVKEIEKQFKDQQNRIIQASPDTLNALNNFDDDSENNGKPKLIIQP